MYNFWKYLVLYGITKKACKTIFKKNNTVFSKELNVFIHFYMYVC